jgi:lambda family phage portal protein
MSDITVSGSGAGNSSPAATDVGGHAAARYSRELASWNPALRSPDADLLPDLNILQARAHDLSRNYALVAGGVQVQLDNIIGAGLKLTAKPDYRALGMSADWAEEWSDEVEAKFRLYADDLDCYCDAARMNTVAGLIGMAFRSYLITGEALATVEYLPRHPARYATAFQMIDPARLSNPHNGYDRTNLRAGVEIDHFGAPLAYHIRSALPSDIRFGTPVSSWKRVARETKWGRLQVIHLFEQERPGQTRGKASIVAGLAKAKMLERFQGVNLEAAIVNAMYAAVIESESSLPLVMESMGGGGDSVADASLTMKAVQDVLHENNSVTLDGVKIPVLPPGDKLTFTSSNHPGPNYAEFEKSTLRHLAASFGVSYEQLARDYSQTNYSGARAGMIEAWKSFTAKRKLIPGRFATLIYSLWLEEAIDRGDVQLPAGTPDFYVAKTAWTRCEWIGPGKGHIDPLKEAQADQLEMNMGTLTLEQACAERGQDWKETLEQVAMEKRYMAKLGISFTPPLPQPAQETATPDPDTTEAKP